MPNRILPAAVTDDVASLPYWEAAGEILSWPTPAARVVRPTQVHAMLRPLVRGAAKRVSDASPAHHADPIAAVQQVAAGAAPSGVFPTAAAFAEAVAYARCRHEASPGVDDLVTMRAYLDQALVSDRRPTLFVDLATTREQLSFVALLIEPHRLDSMRAAFKTFRSAFAAAYNDHHRHYWKAYAKLTRAIDGLAPVARALDRLNSLRALGPPAGEDALAGYRSLSSGGAICPAAGALVELAQQPACGYCGLTLDNSLPAEQTDDIAHRLNAALAVQQRRLASEAVRRILARGGERLDRFVEIVQAADTASLAHVLDGDLIVFLQQLLAQPITPTPEALHLIEQIALAHPVITEDQIDLVLETLRGLLRDQLSSSTSDDSASVPSFYLAKPA